MPDARTHRGAHPEDARDFRPELAGTLRRAVAELSYLLSRDYAEQAALKLVGDRHQLTARQRMAVMRGACADRGLALRSANQRPLSAIAHAAVALDGFNCLITVEALLAGAPVFIGRDGAMRDLASVHGTYRRVEETERAIELLAEQLCAARVSAVDVYLDRPVGNSGRLRARFEAGLLARGLAVTVQLADRVDHVLLSLGVPIASSDSFILERGPWFDLPSAIARVHRLGDFRIDFGEVPEKQGCNRENDGRS